MRVGGVRLGRAGLLWGGDGTSVFLPLSFCFPSALLLSGEFNVGFGCNSGIGILLKWTVRLLGGAYLFLSSSSRLMRRGPFDTAVSYRTYWCSSWSSESPETRFRCKAREREDGRICTSFVPYALRLLYNLQNLGHLISVGRVEGDE